MSGEGLGGGGEVLELFLVLFVSEWSPTTTFSWRGEIVLFFFLFCSPLVVVFFFFLTPERGRSHKSQLHFNEQGMPLFMLYYRASLDKTGRTINCSERSTVEEENGLMSTLTNEPVEST